MNCEDLDNDVPMWAACVMGQSYCQSCTFAVEVRGREASLPGLTTLTGVTMHTIFLCACTNVVLRRKATPSCLPVTVADYLKSEKGYRPGFFQHQSEIESTVMANQYEMH